jgi:hypothetical protein
VCRCAEFCPTFFTQHYLTELLIISCLMEYIAGDSWYATVTELKVMRVYSSLGKFCISFKCILL